MDQCVVSRDEMVRVFEELKTPFKVGMVLREEGANIDCPNVYRKEDGSFRLVYARQVPTDALPGYETWAAESEDLIHWSPVGRLLCQKKEGWDCLQADGSVCLLDEDWYGDHSVNRFDGKFWMTYIGGCLPGYEPDPLRMGVAFSDSLEPGSFTQLPDPILSNEDPDVREFEKRTLYKSTVIRDREERLGFPFVMYYNAKAGQFGIECIGMAVSNDMVHWKRYGENAVLSNGISDRWNIAGDPQIIRFGDLWVMNYFVAKDGMAFDTFACSKDLVHWTKWDGEPLVAPSEDFDKTFAHKPFVLKHDGVVYHFYCAVGESGRGIAVAASVPIDQASQGRED